MLACVYSERLGHTDIADAHGYKGVEGAPNISRLRGSCACIDLGIRSGRSPLRMSGVRHACADADLVDLHIFFNMVYAYN